MVVILVNQWRDAQAELPENWSGLQVILSFDDEETAKRAAAMLTGAGPGRIGTNVRVHVVRGDHHFGLNGWERCLRRLDDSRVRGTLRVAGVDTSEAAADPDAEPTLVEGWDALVASLPPDWSDLYLELVLDAGRDIARASLLLTPVNARRSVEGGALLFRAAHTFGYGAAPQMVRRSLERCDTDQIGGRLRLLRVLSDTNPVGTQGPVWQIGGRTV